MTRPLKDFSSEDGHAPSRISDLHMHDNDSLAIANSSTRATAHRLDLLNLPLTGRKKQLATLKACYRRIKKSSEVVLISGESGTGKSKLAGDGLREYATLDKNGYFVSGKFDQLSNGCPYSALVEAFGDLCDVLSQKSSKKTCRKITTALQEDLTVLKKVIPNLERVTERANAPPADPGTPATAAAQGNFTRFKLACRNFLSAVATKKHPVILLLDDLQWADKETMNVIQSIVTDQTSKHVLVIGTYRWSDADNLRELLDTVAIVDGTPSSSRSWPCTHIVLGNWKHRQVISLIVKCLHVEKDDGDTKDLTELVMKRTDGNPFFVIRFLELLRDQQLLKYNHHTESWKWSVRQIQAETCASANVVQMVSARIQRLSHMEQTILRLAAVQGFRFDLSVLQAAAAREMRRPSQVKTLASNPATLGDRVGRALRVAEELGLIESYTKGSYKFSHDSISTCLYAMIPKGNKLASVHLTIARVLQRLECHERRVFSIADQLNRASPLLVSDANRLDCAQCNLQASKAAMTKAAFRMASEYALQGIAILNVPTKWHEFYYETVLDLHCTAAEALYCCGDVEHSNENLNEVFSHVRCTVDASRAHKIRVLSLGAQARLEEAIDVAFDAVRQLGVKIPMRPTMTNAAWYIMKTKSMLRGKSDARLLALPREENQRMNAAAVLLGIAGHYSSMAMRIPHLCLSIVLTLQLSLKGLATSPTTFSTYGILETVMGNIPGAVRMANLALQLQDTLKSPATLPSVLCIVHTFELHWRVPLHESLQCLEQAHLSALEVGDFDIGFLAAQTWMQMATFCGYPLVELEQQMRQYCDRMLDFDHKSQLYLALPYWQLCLNLMGMNHDPVSMSGEAMEQETYDQEARAAKVDLAPHILNMVRIILAFHFGDVRLLRELMEEYEALDQPAVGHFMQYISKFYVGMAYVTLYRTFLKRSHKKKARKITNHMYKWTKDGCVNTRPLLALLEAERATIESGNDLDSINGLYDLAVDEALSFGNQALEALANERAARYHQILTSNKELGLHYMQRAIVLNNSRGASAKVKFLEGTYKWLMDDNSSSKMTRPLEILAE